MLEASERAASRSVRPVIRSYAGERDLAAVQRIWREVGWVDSSQAEAALGDFLQVGRSLVSDVKNTPECLVHSVPGSIRYLDQQLSLSAVTAVTTSLVARKLGLARYLTADLLARDAADGAMVTILGIFDQGFYDQLGYGNGSYEQWIRFDPATLKVDTRFRVPDRLAAGDWQQMSAALHRRRQGHGGCVLHPPEMLKAETLWTEKGFGLGYRDAEGELSHFFWGSNKGENGPLSIRSLAYRTTAELMELLAVIRSLGDQMSLVEMLEPGEFQLQDLLDQPFRNRRNSRNSKFENSSRSMAYWQVRILDLAGCIEKVVLPTTDLVFNLRLHDPVQKYLVADSAWCGCGGDYVVTLGGESHVQPGRVESLPTLVCGIGAFSRLWLGIRSASSLVISDALTGPETLLTDLDRALRLPLPHLGWDF